MGHLSNRLRMSHDIRRICDHPLEVPSGWKSLPAANYGRENHNIEDFASKVAQDRLRKKPYTQDGQAKADPTAEC